MTDVSRETHPEYFYEGSSLTNIKDTNGLYTAKDFSDIVL